MTRLLARFRGRTRAAEQSVWNGNGEVRRLSGAARATSRARYVVTSAESAPCTCPDFCERDHEND